MPVIVEDGTIIPGANAYVDVATADAYLANSHDADWSALSVMDKERFLILGAAFVDNAQIYQYSGTKQTAVQDMAWPRHASSYHPGGPDIPDGIIPGEIRRANIEAARLAALGNLPVTPGLGAGASEVKKEKVDVVEVEYFHSLENRATGGGSIQPIGLDAISRYGHPMITGLVAPLLNVDTLAPTTTGGGVPRNMAARRGGRFQPDNTPPAFVRGQHDYYTYRGGGK